MLLYKMNINQEEIVSRYHPFRIPPHLQLCQIHRKCSQFGEMMNRQQTNSSCPCCSHPQRNQLGLCCNISQIYDVCQPVGYYFTYVRVMCLALFVIMIISGIYCLVEIVNQCSASSEQQLCDYVYGIPIPKIHVFFKLPLIILNIIVIVFLYFVIAYLFFRKAYLHQRDICNFEKPSDFSLLISGVDYKEINPTEIKQFLAPFAVKDIIITFKIDKYIEKLAQKSILQAKRDLYQSLSQHHKKQKIQKQINKIDDRLLHIKNKFILGQDMDLRTDKIIVTFQTAVEKSKFEQMYKMNLSQNIYHTFCGGSPLVICDQPLFIQPLGEPHQIIWENLQLKSRSRYLRILVSNLVSLFIIFVSFVCIVYLSKQEKQEQRVGGDVVLSIVFAVLIQVVNTILVFSIKFLTDWERRYTMTGKISVMLYKNCFGFFLNTTLLPFSLFLFSLFEPDEDDLIRNILSIFFISNLISPIIGLYLHPRFLFRKYQRYKIKNQGRNCMITQIKANAIFEKVGFMLDERYAIATQLFMNCMFYAAVFPFGVLITIIGMTITFWSSKWWLLNYCSLPKFSFRIGRNINYISCLFPCVYAFGYASNLYMFNQQNAEFNKTYSIYIAVATIPLSLFFLFFGQKIAINWILKNRSSVTQCLQRQKNFFQYKNFNPTTFLHSNLHIQNIIQRNNKRKERRQTMWDNLISYVMAKQMGLNYQDANDELESSRSSRISKLSEYSNKDN